MQIATTMPEAWLVGRSERVVSTWQVPPDKDHYAMKNVLCAICFVCCLSAASALSQTASVLTSLAQPMQMADHTEHASQHAMGQETSLLDTSAYTYAKGEVPLAELGSIPYEAPLGDVARALRKERAMNKTPKASVVFEK
jgi:hypothetical protein